MSLETAALKPFEDRRTAFSLNYPLLPFLLSVLFAIVYISITKRSRTATNNPSNPSPSTAHTDLQVQSSDLEETQLDNTAPTASGDHVGICPNPSEPSIQNSVTAHMLAVAREEIKLFILNEVAQSLCQSGVPSDIAEIQMLFSLTLDEIFAKKDPREHPIHRLMNEMFKQAGKSGKISTERLRAVKKTVKNTIFPKTF